MDSCVYQLAYDYAVSVAIAVEAAEIMLSSHTTFGFTFAVMRNGTRRVSANEV